MNANDIIFDNQDYTCTWPDGDSRVVRVHKIVNGKAFIIWNDKHEPMELKVGNETYMTNAVGLTDQVPLEWITEYERD